jgi:hypothetical protein
VSVAPDYLEPVLGWRIWHAAEKAGSTSLWSIYHRVVWPAGEPLRAECAKRRLIVRFRSSARKRHPAPAVGCECGIYALSTEQTGIHVLSTEDFWMMLRELEAQQKLPVLGRVSLWGEVHEHERGWRASLAYPERLYVFRAPSSDGGIATRLAAGLERYGVPIEVLSTTSADVGSAIAELVPPVRAA